MSQLHDSRPSIDRRPQCWKCKKLMNCLQNGVELVGSEQPAGREQAQAS